MRVDSGTKGVDMRDSSKGEGLTGSAPDEVL